MTIDLNVELKRLERAKQLVEELQSLGFNVNVEATETPAAAHQPAARKSKRGLGEKFRQIQKAYWAEVHRIAETEKVPVDKARTIYTERKANLKQAAK